MSYYEYFVCNVFLVADLFEERTMDITNQLS